MLFISSCCKPLKTDQCGEICTCFTRAKSLLPMYSHRTDYACYFSTWKWLLLYVIGVSFRNKKDMLENLKIILL